MAWGPWSSVSEGSTKPGGVVTAVTAGAGRIALFLADPHGGVFTASGSPTAGWGPWSSVSQGSTVPGGMVTSVAAGAGRIALFLADPGGGVFTASGSPTAGWGPWSSVSQGSTVPGGMVTAVAAGAGRIALFLADPHGGVYTALGFGESFRPGKKAPLHILGIQHKNPDPPGDPNWAASHDRTFPALPSVTVRNFDPEKEWQQVLAPDDEYDQILVGASGWMIHPRTAEADVPFTHPFGFDWEFDLALDDPQYTFLLTPGNANSVDDYEDLINRAKKLDIPVPKSALLGVEWDAKLVPQSFRDEVNEG